MEFHYISWQKMHEMCWELAEKIVGGDFHIAPNKRDRYRNLSLQYIVAISRGGLVVAWILSDFLKLPIYNIAIESYEEIGKSKEPHITQDLGSADIKDKNILLVDEICDTGKTFERTAGYLKNINVGARHGEPLQMQSACLVLKSHSSFTPDFYCAKIDRWVIFPWEVRETVECLRDKMKREEIISLGLPKEMVEKYYK